MTEKLADLFAAARSPSIGWEGSPAYAVWEIDPLPQELAVTFLSAKAEPVQGLTVKVDQGTIRVNGEESPQITLWRDTAPDTVHLLICAEPGAKLKIWNIWRGSVGGHDVTHAWLGNSGMRTDVSSSVETVLRCSDGTAEVNFEDLTVRVTSVLS